MVSMIVLIISIYGVSATCADMLLSLLLKSKRLKYQKDNLFVTRTFASKSRTMSFTFGTLSMLILLSLLCLNFSSLANGVYQATIENFAPYDVEAFDNEPPFEDFNEYLRIIEEDYTINDALEYELYKEPSHQIQDYYDIQFYDFDPVIKLSDYNKLLELRNMDTIELKDDEYFLLTSDEKLHIVENNDKIKHISVSGRELHLKGIDTKSFWFSMNNKGRFLIVAPNNCVEGLEVYERHLVVDTKEDTTSKLDEKLRTDLKHFFVTVDENGVEHEEYYRVHTRGSEIEQQNSLTAILSSICLYIAFILISAVGTILAVQALSDSTKYRYRYLTLKRLGVNDKSLFGTIRKQLLILFGVPVIYSIIASFCILFSVNNVYYILLESKFSYLLYFVSGLAIFFLIYGVYWITTYLGFKRNINEENLR